MSPLSHAPAGSSVTEGNPPPACSILDSLETFLLRLHTPLLKLSSGCLFVVMLLAVIDVIGRSLFKIPLPGGLELTETLMALAIFPLFAYVSLADNHMNVNMLYNKTSERVQGMMSILCGVLSAAYVGLLAWQMALGGLEKLEMGETTYVYGIPIGVLVLFAAVCLVLFSLTLLQKALRVMVHSVQNGHMICVLLATALGLILAALPFCFAGQLMGTARAVIGGLGMLYLFTLILLGMPIGLSMLLTGFQGILLIMPNSVVSFAMVSGAPYPAVTASHLSVIPMFLLMGELALIAGISAALFRAASAWLGRLPGGLAVATVAGCAGFAAVCGESIPTAMTMASVSMPEMRKRGYDPAFGAACLSLGGTLGILIPPSLGFIVYSIVVEESVAKLFTAAIFPALLLVVVICGIVVIRAIRNPNLAPRGENAPWGEKLRSLVGLLPVFLLFGVIVGGILTGTCSPTEGGALGSFVALVYAMIHGRVPFSAIWHKVESSAILSGKIFLVLMGVAVLGSFLAATRLPFVLTDVIIGLDAGRWTVLGCTILLFILLGCLMNVIPMIMLTLPALFPTIAAMGFDPIWFGVICVLLMELGQITPPIGVLVFALAGVLPDVSVERIYRQVTPFFFGILLTVGLIILFPSIALWLPSKLF